MKDTPSASSLEMDGKHQLGGQEGGGGLEDLWEKVMNEQYLCAFVSVITKGGVKPFVKKVMRL